MIGCGEGRGCGRFGHGRSFECLCLIGHREVARCFRVMDGECGHARARAPQGDRDDVVHAPKTVVMVWL